VQGALNDATTGLLTTFPSAPNSAIGLRLPDARSAQRRRLAKHLGVSDFTVSTTWKKWGLQPWRVETFKFSTDPELEAKIRDVIGPPATRGTFTSVKDLIAAIEIFIDAWNERCEPFVWTETADQIIPHATRGQATSTARY
jgi:hypothetical protein